MGVKICFHSCCYENQKFFTRVVRVALVSHWYRLCLIRVAHVLLVSGTRVVNRLDRILLRPHF